MKSILFLISSLMCTASAMDSSFYKDKTDSQNDSLSSLQAPESENPVMNLWKQSLQQNDVRAQYDLFCIYRDGLFGQQKNPKPAILCGLKARNRPNPYPCVIEELPRYLWNLYEENLHLNPSLAESYLIQGANLCPIDGFCPIEFTMAYIGNSKKSVVKNFKPTGYVKGDNEVITENDSGLRTEYVYEMKFCPEYPDALNKYVEREIRSVDLLYPVTSQKTSRINFLHRVNRMIDQILKEEHVFYLYYRSIAAVCRNSKIVTDYCDQFKDHGFVQLVKLGSKLGIETKEWPQSWSVNNKKLLLEKIKDIESQILSLMERNYYLPGFIDVARSLIENKEYDKALGAYCQYLKHMPNGLEGVQGIHKLYEKMKDLSLAIPKEPFNDLKVGLKHIIDSPPNFFKYDAYESYITFARVKLIELDPGESILSLSLEHLKLKNDVITLTGVGGAYFNANDPENAYKYYLAAAQMGGLAFPMVQVANMLLGSMSSKSEAPEKEALDWYKEAAATGNPFAKKLLARLEAMFQKRDMPEKVTNLDEWSVKYNLPKPKKQTTSKKSKKGQRAKQQQTTTLIEDSSNHEMASMDVLEIVDNISETEIESFAKEMDMEGQTNKENEPINAELTLQEELKLYESEKYPLKTKKSEILREQMKKMAMIHQFQQTQPTQPNQNILVLDKAVHAVLCDIFDLTKPNISDKEFIQFASSEALKGIIKIFKTKSGYALVGKTGQTSEESCEGLTAGTHWNHTGKRDGLDCHFVAEVRHILKCLGVTPESVTVK